MFLFLDKEQLKELDSDHFSPTRQTEAFIISETEDDLSRAGMRVTFYICNIKFKLF